MDRSCCTNIKLQRGNPLHYLRLYFNFCYYIGILPFRFVYDQEEGKYKLQTNPIQKVNSKHIFKKNRDWLFNLIFFFQAFCILTMSLCIAEETITFRDSVNDILHPEKGQDDPLAYFNMFYTCSNFLYYVTVIQTVWGKSKAFLSVIQLLHECRTSAYFETDQNINKKVSSYNLKKKINIFHWINKKSLRIVCDFRPSCVWQSQFYHLLSTQLHLFGAFLLKDWVGVGWK